VQQHTYFYEVIQLFEERQDVFETAICVIWGLSLSCNHIVKAQLLLKPILLSTSFSSGDFFDQAKLRADHLLVS
jgi:hypothetical protein